MTKAAKFFPPFSRRNILLQIFSGEIWAICFHCLRERAIDIRGGWGVSPDGRRGKGLNHIFLLLWLMQTHPSSLWSFPSPFLSQEMTLKSHFLLIDRLISEEGKGRADVRKCYVRRPFLSYLNYFPLLLRKEKGSVSDMLCSLNHDGCGDCVRIQNVQSVRDAKRICLRNTKGSWCCPGQYVR